MTYCIIGIEVIVLLRNTSTQIHLCRTGRRTARGRKSRNPAAFHGNRKSGNLWQTPNNLSLWKPAKALPISTIPSVSSIAQLIIPNSHQLAYRQKNPLGKRRLNPRGNKRRLEKIRLLCCQVQRTQKHVVLFLDSTLQTSGKRIKS